MAFVADIPTSQTGEPPEPPPTGQLPEPPEPMQPPRQRRGRTLIYLALAAALVIGFILLFALGVGDASAAGGCGGG